MKLLTDDDKLRFVRDHCALVGDIIRAQLATGKIPDYWREPELRNHIADKFGEWRVKMSRNHTLNYNRDKREGKL